MTRKPGRVFAPAMVTVAFVIVLALGAARAGLAIALWVLCMAGVVLHGFIRDLRAESAEVSRRFDAALLPRGQRVAVPGELLRMEREIVLGVANADTAHRQLLPLLRTAAAARLASHHGIDLMRSPSVARARLGDQAWELLRPDRPPPADRHARGIPRDVVAKLIAKVESL